MFFMKSEKKDLTFLYSLHQFIYWASIGGVVSFAATYLTAKGFSAANVGWILFSAYILSFLLQPVLASYADRSGKNIIPKMMLCLSAAAFLCFSAVRFVRLSMPVFFVLYAAGIMFLDMCVPLLNSVVLYFNRRGWSIQYGLGRGFGGFGFAIATLVFGNVIEAFGVDTLLLSAIGCIAAAALISFLYPRGEEMLPAETGQTQEVSSLLQFIRRYRWYCASLFGVLFLAMFHSMVENYMIEVLRPIGGDNSNVGMALFIATVTELPSMTAFPAIRKKLGSKRVLIIAGIGYTVRAVLFYLAGSVAAVYVAQCLQCITYVFLSTVQMYYADECTSAADMVKGQSLITAFYTLGCAVGNLIGGNLISLFGVPVMLVSGVVMAALGLVILLCTVSKALRPGAFSENMS